MRTNDIEHVYPSTYERTEEIYLLTIMGKPYPLEELPLEALQHAMCAKSGGKVGVDAWAVLPEWKEAEHGKAD